MITFAIIGCEALLLIAALFALIRLFKGPRTIDRIMTTDALAICVIGFLILESLQNRSPYFIDLILVFSLLNFVGIVAFIYYLTRRSSSEKELS